MDYFVDAYLNAHLLACLNGKYGITSTLITNKTRTTNHFEAWHAALDRCIRRSKPNIFLLINEIENQQQNFEHGIVAQKNQTHPTQDRKSVV